jgi:hypothetical protein
MYELPYLSIGLILIESFRLDTLEGVEHRYCGLEAFVVSPVMRAFPLRFPEEVQLRSDQLLEVLLGGIRVI